MSDDNEQLNEEIKGLIKGGLGMIPGFGTLLNEVIFDIRARVKQKRFEKFVHELSDKLKTLEVDQVKLDFFKTDEFVDFFENAMISSTKNKSEEKIRIFAEITFGVIKRQKITDYDFELMLLKIIEQLTEFEMQVLHELKPNDNTNFQSIFEIENNPERDEYERKHQYSYNDHSLNYNSKTLFGLIPNDARIAIEGLIAKSLALDSSFSKMDSKPRDSISLTPLGSKVIDYLDYNNIKLLNK